jgi:hypothetical protein
MARRVDYVSPAAGKIKDAGGTTFVIHYGTGNVHRERYAGDEPAGMHATPALLATRAGTTKPATVCELFEAERERAEGAEEFKR